MSVKLKYFFKSFVFYGILYAIVQSLFDYLIFDEMTSIIGFFVKGCFFGLLMALFLVSMHISSIKDMGITDITEDTLKSNQSKFIPVQISMDDVYNLIKNSSYTFTAVQKNNVDIQKITCRHGGEKITVIPAFENEKEGYIIQSKPIFPLKITDMGRGLRHIRILEKLLLESEI